MSSEIIIRAVARVFNEAVTLRNCLSEMASEIVHARSVPRRAVQAVNDVIGNPSGTTRLVKTSQVSSDDLSLT